MAEKPKDLSEKTKELEDDKPDYQEKITFLVSTIAQYIPNSVVDGETSRFKPDWDELDGSFKWGRLVE